MPDSPDPASAAWWQRVFEVVDGVLDLAPEQRAAGIAHACGGDARLAAAVSAVLTGADDAVLLESPALGLAAPLVADVAADLDAGLSASLVGAYRILREIGHGGMGTVYLAARADQQFEKTVALKLLPRWSAGDERLMRRFVDERQILAGLDHPDIARLLDGGVTDDGLPWFAMEYVEGIPIDRYCDERRLPIEARLELFSRVCGAVQYAHRHLVVHRDLKPANVLVTRDGGVKLLDFGIAKLLSSETAAATLTMVGERLLTPLYASPEQLRGEPVSTATDIYSLGVLLHHLLTGRYPYRVTTREMYEVARAILEQEPERPSTAVVRASQSGTRRDPAVARDVGFARRLSSAKLARRLRGDLDTIVVTAMQKDPARRYGTAEQLAADVRRHLAGLPLAARPESRWSRARKFARRHRIGVGLAAAVALLVAGFAGVTTVQSIRIRIQAGRIALERDRAEQVSDFLAGLFRRSDPYVGAGAALTARAMLDSGAARIDRELAAQPDVRAQMMLEIGRAYFGLGARDRARRFAEVSLAIRRRTAPEAQREIAQTLDFLGQVLLEQGELPGAERAYREALDLRRQLLGPADRDVARTLNGLSAALYGAGRFREADSVSQEAVAIDDAWPGDNQLDLAQSLESRAHALRELGDFAAAGQLYGRVLTLRRQALPEEHPEVASTVLNLAAALGDAGQPATAETLFRYGLEVKRRLLGEAHPDVAGDEAQYGRLLHRLGRDREADVLYRHALSTARRLPPPHPLTATVLLGLGELRLGQNAPEAAEPLLREALAIREATLHPGHPHVAEVEQFLGAAALALGRYEEANRYLQWRLRVLQAAYGDNDPRLRAAFERLTALYDAAGLSWQTSPWRVQLEALRP